MYKYRYLFIYFYGGWVKLQHYMSIFSVPFSLIIIKKYLNNIQEKPLTHISFLKIIYTLRICVLTIAKYKGYLLKLNTLIHTHASLYFV